MHKKHAEKEEVKDGIKTEPEPKVDDLDDMMAMIRRLQDDIDKIFDTISHLISETGTGRLLDIYGLKKYDLTKDDLNRGKFQLKKDKNV